MCFWDVQPGAPVWDLTRPLRPRLQVASPDTPAGMPHCVCPLSAGVLDVHQLLELLQTGGEPMSGEELQQVLQVLTGSGDPLEALPDCIDAHTFQTEILGFEG